ncbi:MFS transporter [Achromobacter xylosoxidans]
MSSLAPLFHGAARARAFSLLGTTFGIGLSFGPLASGWLVEAAGWQWVFLATGLVGLLGAAMVAASVRATPAGMRGLGSTGAARSASPARWACSPAACCWRPKPAGAVPAYWARCWHLPCWPWPSCASSAASPARCWSWACSATPASSACRRWPPRPPFFSSR